MEARGLNKGIRVTAGKGEEEGSSGRKAKEMEDKHKNGKREGGKEEGRGGKTIKI